MSGTAANLVCLRHPKYDGLESPDLNCKVCCSKFVDRIRADQRKLFDVNGSNLGKAHKEFKPLQVTKIERTEPKRQINFDGSWI